MTALRDERPSEARQRVVLEALAVLDGQDVPYALRNGELAVDDPAADIDILLRERDLPRLHAALTEAGWALLRAPGHRRHRFYLREAADLSWVKLDVVTGLRYGREHGSTEESVRDRRLVDGLWLVSAVDAHRHSSERLAGRREVPSLAERLARTLPVSTRRRGCIVAVLGPDGAGKGTVTEGVAATLPVAVTRLYLGDRRARTPEAARPETGGSAVDSLPRGRRRAAREVAFVARKLAVRAPALLRGSLAAWLGHVVLTDRHPLDVLAVRPPRTRAAARVERFLATHVVPSPDAIVVLDAPGQVLFDRKGEHTPERLEAWRQGYREHLVPRGAVLVDATAPVEANVAQARHVVWRALAARRGWRLP